jgi:hypothetical protein
MNSIDAYVKDIKKYSDSVDMKVVEKLASRLAGTMAKPDARYVAVSDKKECGRVRNGFIKKSLGVDNKEKADKAIAAVGESMKKDRTKSRVTFYYLLIQQLRAKSAYLK